MPQQLEQPLFALKQGEPTMVETGDGFIVAVPAEIVEADPKADPAGYGQVRQAVARSVGTDLASVFADALRARAAAAHQSARSGQRHRPTAMNVSVSPGFASFRAAHDAGRGTLVWRRGVADLETPVAAFLKLAHGRPNSFLLESVEGGAARGRYSIIGMEPDLVWRCRDGQAEVNRYAQSAPHAFVADTRPALDSLRAMIAETRLDVPANLPPMAGGLVGYLGYDMVRQMERLPAKNRDVIGVPEGADDAADAVRDLRQRERRTDAGGAGLSAGRHDAPRRPGSMRRSGWTRRRPRWNGRCRTSRRR